MIEYSLNDLFYADTTHKQIVLREVGGPLVFTNADITSESFAVYESIFPDNELRYGSFEPNCLEIEINYTALPLTGKVFLVEEILNDRTDEPFVWGTYKVLNEESEADRAFKSLTMYDTLYEIANVNVISWYNSQFPTESTTKTIKQFRDSFAAYLGIVQETNTLPNDALVVKKSIETDSLSAGEVLRCIAELNARFPHITRTNKLRYIKVQPGLSFGLFPAVDLYPSDELFPAPKRDGLITRSDYIEEWHAGYKTRVVDKLVLQNKEDEVGATIGTGSNVYIISGNFLAYSFDAAQMQTAAQNIYNEISGVTYVPCEVNCVGNPCIEVGDPIRVNSAYATVDSFVGRRTFEGIQVNRDTYAIDGSEYQAAQINTVSSQIKRINGHVTKVEANVEGITVRVENIEDGSASVIQQLSNQINARVTTTDFNSEVAILENAINARVTSSEFDSAIEILEDAISAKVSNSDFQSAVSVLNNSISAKVAKTYGNQSFGWEMTDSNIVFKANGNDVLKVDSNGLSVNGSGTFSGTLSGASGVVNSLICNGEHSSLAFEDGYLNIYRPDIGQHTLLTDHGLTMTGGISCAAVETDMWVTSPSGSFYDLGATRINGHDCDWQSLDITDDQGVSHEIHFLGYML